MRPLIIGHRGAPSYRPEHTESGYRLAVRQGADLVEPDVVPTRDGVLIVRHEARLESTTDIATRPEFAERRRGVTMSEYAPGEHAPGDYVGWFAEDFDWAEIQELRATERIPELRPGSAVYSGTERVLRLREVVAIIDDEARQRGRHCGLVIELKHDARVLGFGMDYVELLASELDGLWHLDVMRELRIESFEAPALDRLREAGTDAKLVLLVAAADEVALEEEGPERLTIAGLDDAAKRYDGISVRTSLLGQHDPTAAGTLSAARSEARPDAQPEASAETHPAPLTGSELVDAAHARGLEVLTYTLRDEDAFLPAAFAGHPEAYWEALIATGVDGVFADAPDRVVSILDDVVELER